MRFERVTLVTSAVVAEVMRRVYDRVLADWRPKVTPHDAPTAACGARIYAPWLTHSTYLPTCLLTCLATCLLAYSCAEVRVEVRAVPTSDAGLLARANAIPGDDAWCRA